MKEFDFAAKRAEAKKKAGGEEEVIVGEFKFEGNVYKVREVPSARTAHLVAAVNNAEGLVVVQRVFSFMERALLKDDLVQFEKDLLELEIDEVMEVFQEVLTIASEGKDGGSSSDSSGTSKPAGKSSTARAASRTRSTSRSDDF